MDRALGKRRTGTLTERPARRSPGKSINPAGAKDRGPSRVLATARPSIPRAGPPPAQPYLARKTWNNAAAPSTSAAANAAVAYSMQRPHD
ncbi:hypothetical protein J6590_038561 [Homalodisca vitripennis]|nr:hypothetical protein J6590_038561 [Homalodisca vitripennis]